MHNKILSTLVLLTGMLMMYNAAIAEPLSVKADDDIESVLQAHKGKPVTIKLNSGEELTGKVGEVTGKLLVLQELTGKEFFDAAVSLDKIAAVIVRAKEQ